MKHTYTIILLHFIAIGCAVGGFTSWQSSEVQSLVSTQSTAASIFTTTVGDVNPADKNPAQEDFGYGYAAYPEHYMNISNQAYGGLWDRLGLFGNIGDLYEFDYKISSVYNYSEAYPISTQQQGYDLYYNKFESMINNETYQYDPPAYGGISYCTTGHSMWQHYMAKWSPSSITTVLVEVGEGIIGANAKYAFMRGAAKQYGKQWGTVISTFHGPQANFNGWFGGYPNYPASLVTNLLGHSVSFLSRVAFSTYFAGANYQLLENGEVTLWQDEAHSYYWNDPINTNGVYGLSPYGNFFKAFHPFESFDRGTPFIPIAVVLPLLHGIFYAGPNTAANNQYFTWATLPLQAPDYMTHVLLNTIWDGMFNVTYDGNTAGTYEYAQIANGPYGEIFDFFLEDVTSTLLSEYPIVYYTGGIQISSSYATMLNSYANSGGFVVVNIAQLIVGGNQLQTGFSYTSSATSSATLTSLQWGSTSANIWQAIVNVTAVSISGSTSYQLYGNGNVPLMTLNPVGSGYIAVTLVPYLPDGQITKFLLQQLTPLVSPFSVTSPEGPHPIMYQFNKKSTGWAVTLINNNGVEKPNNGTTVYDSSKAAYVTVAVNSQVISGTVSGTISYSTISESTVSTNSIPASSSFSMTVNPGEIIIFDIPFTYGSPTASSSTTGGSSSTTTISSTSSSTTCSGGGGSQIAVYADSLASGWSDWTGNAVTHSLSNTSPVHSGSYSISFGLSNYGELYFHVSPTFQIGTAPNLQFWVNGGSLTISNALWVQFYDSSNSIVGSRAVVSVTASTWNQVNINALAAAPAGCGLSSSQVVSGFLIQYTNGDAPGTIYLDDISFGSAGCSSGTSTISTSTTTTTGGCCSQYAVSGISRQSSWTSGSEWQFTLTNGGSSAPGSVTVEIDADGYAVSNGGNMAYSGSSGANYFFTISSPSSFSAGSTETYTFQVAGVPTTMQVSVTVSSCS